MLTEMKKMRKNRFKRGCEPFYPLRNADRAWTPSVDSSVSYKKSIFSVLRILQKTVLTLFYSVLLFGIETAFENFFVFAVQKPAFRIQEIAIENNVLNSREDILNMIRLKPDTNLIICDMENIQEKLLQMENVKEVRIIKQLPGKLTIVLKERLPFFRMYIGGELIDSQGKQVILKNGFMLYQHLPLLKGLELSSDKEISFNSRKRYESTVSMVRMYMDYFEKLPIGKIDKVDIQKDFTDFFLFNKVVLRFPLDYSDEIFLRLSKVLSDIQKNRIEVALIDLRFRDIVVKTR